MRRSAASAGRLSLLLAASALSWLALASPAATASPTTTPAASASPSAAPGTLDVRLLGPVDDSAYPNVSVNLSIADAVTGRPETTLDASNVFMNPSGQVTAVSASTVPSTASLPAAYVVDIDTSGSMGEAPAGGTAPMVAAKSLAKKFVASLGPNDLVKVITFDESTKERTGWLKGNDPSLGTAIDQIQSEARKTYVSAGFLDATKIANGRPDGYDRRAIVMITDASPADKDTNLKSAAMKQQLGSPTFIVGLLPPAQVGSDLSQLLSDVATYTGGSYQTVDSSQDPTALFGPVLASTRSTWKVTFSTDLSPDGGTHDQTLTITDAQHRTGSATLKYHSSGLFKISPLNVDNLATGATVTGDRTVKVTVGGTKKWADARIDLYVDCNPDQQKCADPLSADNGPLVWQITVAPMSQGLHHVYIRLTTKDAANATFSDHVELDFTRSGTSWNVAAVILVIGLAILLIGAFFIASRRRGARHSQRRPQ